METSVGKTVKSVHGSVWIATVYKGFFVFKAAYLIDGMAGIYAKLYCKSSEHDAIREFVCFTGRSNHTITGSICNETMWVGMSVEDY
jgi:hypothetical protein